MYPVSTFTAIIFAVFGLVALWVVVRTLDYLLCSSRCVFCKRRLPGDSHICKECASTRPDTQ